MKIVTLTGASASGKDAILNKILETNENIKPIISVTTRPMRDGETDGVEYKFVDSEEFKEMYQNDEFIECREYNTVEGKWLYGTPKNAIDIESDDVYVAILDTYGVSQLKLYLSEVETENEIDINSILINCNGRERIIRSLIREQYLNDYQVAEICRRYLADMEELALHKDLFDLSLRNETSEDMERCIKIIGGLIEWPSD